MRRPVVVHIEAEIAAYEENKRELERLRRDIILASAPPDPNAGIRAKGTASDPTGRTAIVLTQDRRLNELERIVSAVERVYDGLPETHKMLVRLRYWTNPKPTWNEIAERLGVSKMQAFRWRSDIVRAIGDVLGWK